MKANVFLGYAREDEEKVEQLYQKLSGAGFKPWMDKKDILPGERWESCIQKAIRRSDFFLACLSANSIDRRGWIQREIKQALDIWQEKLEDDIYLIPVRLEDCEVPESLRVFQWVNLFEADGWTQLVKAIQIGMERLYAKTARGELDRMLERQERNFEETANLFGLSVSQLKDILEALPPRESKILQFRYGLEVDGKKRTCEEIAQKFGLPAWRIQELEEKALDTLIQVFNDGGNRVGIGKSEKEALDKLKQALAEQKNQIPQERKATYE